MFLNILATRLSTNESIIILAVVTFLLILMIWTSNFYGLNLLDLTSNRSRISILWLMQDVNKGVQPILEWVSVDHLEENYTSKLIYRCCLENEDVPGNGSLTVNLKFLNIDDGKPTVLSTGNAHEVFFQALDEYGNNCNYGGDYFEINLAGESWKSRPPSRDIGNGTYSFILQVHPDFAGDYNLTISLLYRNFGGIMFVFPRYTYNKQLRNTPISFLRSEVKLAELHLCRKSDFNRGFWAGRWTRLAKNDSCEISDDGRYRCLEHSHPCTFPWCDGPLGMLESNGWTYSTHCSFKLFLGKDAWNCLNNRWLFFWGDSNHVDTIRNILFFILGVPLEEFQKSPDEIVRHFDKTFTNPKNMSQKVRITQFWNAHYYVSGNFLGLKTLTYKKYRDSLMSFFNGPTVPDTIIFNSGLHDGCYYRSLNQFIMGVDYAVSFWRQIIQRVNKRGLEIPNFIFRSTVASSHVLYDKGSNPNRMEVFNWILLEKLKTSGLITGIIDCFDLTWSWHFDLRCNNGNHYGRPPSKTEWIDGEIGHQYFVDLMIGHVILNAICMK